MVDGQQPTFVSGIPPTFPLRTSSLYSLCLRRISPLQQKGFKSRQYWKRFSNLLRILDQLIFAQLFGTPCSWTIGLSLLASTGPFGQWPPWSKSSGPGLIAVWPSLSTLPHPALSNPIIHPREQLDWGEADDRWTVSPDCADLIEKGCSRLIRKQDLWKRLQQSQVAGSREIPHWRAAASFPDRYPARED